jgi:type I restriction enzyme, S subunit
LLSLDDALVAKKERLIELLQEKRAALITRAVTKGLDPTVPVKDSGVEWLGEIPAHWDVKALSRTLLRITYGFTNPMPVADAGPYMLTALDIGDGEILYASARRTTEEAFERLLTDKSRPRAGDLLITKDGTLGRVAVAGLERMCINQSIALLRFAPTVDVGFIQHTLRAAPYQERMTFEAGGTAIKHIYITRLARMSIALPAKEEQRVIAAFLDRETARIDALIAKIRDAISRLKELRAALISAAVTGKIDVRDEAA